MTDAQKNLLLLIKSALTSEKYTLPADFDAASVFAIAKAHGATALAYYGALNCGVDSACEAMREAFSRVCREILVGERQTADVKEIIGALNNCGADFMPLKGVNLKKNYPRPEMRRMSDADILVKIEQYDRIRPVMLSLGYTENMERDHEYNWQKGSTHIELHKRLIPSYNKDYYAYFGNGWQLAKPICDGSFEHKMSAEDEMIYLFTHFAKHYRDAGIGVRHIADLWVYRNANPNLDEDYIKNELTTLKLYDFYRNILRAIAALFEDGEHDEVTDFIAEVIMSSGEYGRKTTKFVSSALKQKKSGKNASEIIRGKVFRLIFLPYDSMCVAYPILKKIPVLLPLMWCVRIVSRGLKKGTVKGYVNGELNVNDKQIDSYQQTLNFVGLDFNFSEQ